MTTSYSKPLRAAVDLVEGNRAAAYGDAQELHDHAARILNVIRPASEPLVTARDVALTLFAVKMARAARARHEAIIEDSVVDGLAYLSFWFTLREGEGDDTV